MASAIPLILRFRSSRVSSMHAQVAAFTSRICREQAGAILLSQFFKAAKDHSLLQVQKNSLADCP